MRIFDLHKYKRKVNSDRSRILSPVGTDKHFPSKSSNLLGFFHTCNRPYDVFSVNYFLWWRI
jgi:hypothetical protein